MNKILIFFVCALFLTACASKENLEDAEEKAIEEKAGEDAAQEIKEAALQVAELPKEETLKDKEEYIESEKEKTAQETSTTTTAVGGDVNIGSITDASLDQSKNLFLKIDETLKNLDPESEIAMDVRG